MSPARSFAPALPHRGEKAVARRAGGGAEDHWVPPKCSASSASIEGRRAPSTRTPGTSVSERGRSAPRPTASARAASSTFTFGGPRARGALTGIRPEASAARTAGELLGRGAPTRPSLEKGIAWRIMQKACVPCVEKLKRRRVGHNQGMAPATLAPAEVEVDQPVEEDVPEHERPWIVIVCKDPINLMCT